MGKFAAELLAWNEKTNLTAITDPMAVAEKHILDSLIPGKYISSLLFAREITLLDIGSGGGFPGIPLKIFMLEIRVTMVDSVRKKVNFLKYAILTLKLEGIDAVHARVEDLAGQAEFAGQFDVVISRVFTALDGDGQMDPNDLPLLLDPVVEDRADYAKGNRLFTGEAYQKIPKVRYFGNALLSLFTKIASGYWHVADSQSGYTAINKKALHLIDWDRLYTWYGHPNDILVRLNVHNLRVKDVPVEPVYNIGEKSGINIKKAIFKIGWLLVKLFFWRMKEKYIIRDFHPLVFFYALGGFFSLITVVLSVRLLVLWGFTGHIPSINALAAMFSFISASQFTLFAMWFDMEANKDLK